MCNYLKCPPSCVKPEPGSRRRAFSGAARLAANRAEAGKVCGGFVE